MKPLTGLEIGGWSQGYIAEPYVCGSLTFQVVKINLQMNILKGQVKQVHLEWSRSEDNLDGITIKAG